MIIQIELRDQWIESLKSGMITFIKYLYGWISKDDEFLGHVLASSHFIISATFYILVFACHVVYPSTYFQLFVFIFVVIVWLQHVFLRVCISVLAEQELTKLDAPSIPLFKAILHKLNVSFEDFTNYFLTAETTCVIMFSLEMLSKLTVYLYEKNGNIY